MQAHRKAALLAPLNPNKPYGLGIRFGSEPFVVLVQTRRTTSWSANSRKFFSDGTTIVCGERLASGCQSRADGHIPGKRMSPSCPRRSAHRAILFVIVLSEAIWADFRRGYIGDEVRFGVLDVKEV